MEIFCSSENDTILNCSFLVFAVLCYLLNIKPCHFARYSRALVTGELTLQGIYIVIYLVWCLKFHSLLICDLLPFTSKYWFGDILIYKLFITMASIYVVWFYFLANLEFKINWGGDDDCGCPEDDDDDDDDRINCCVAPSPVNCATPSDLPSAQSPCKSATPPQIPPQECRPTTPSQSPCCKPATPCSSSPSSPCSPFSSGDS
ncbi:hypothetical protein WDU94_011975 [Cyamophila willieti]